MPLQSTSEQLFLQSSKLSELGFIHGFSLRTGGVSHDAYSSLNLGVPGDDTRENIDENHRRFAKAVGYDARSLYSASQVHKNDVLLVKSGDDAQSIRRLEADALITRVEGHVASVRVADCAPVLFADPKTRAVAAVHMGWRSTVMNIAEQTVAALQSHCDAPAQRLFVAIGPHIGPCCFEVGEDVARTIEASASSAHPEGPYIFEVSAVSAPKAQNPHIDLKRVILSQLSALGVPKSQIDIVPGCTACEPLRFFSFRRDGKPSGRHLAVIMSA